MFFCFHANKRFPAIGKIQRNISSKHLTNKTKLLSFACGVSDYKDYYTDTTVKFVLSLTEDKLAEAEQAGLHKKFKLEAAINTSNMVSLPC